MTTKLLNRQEIIDAPDIQKEKVSVPEWGGDVMVHGLLAGEKDTYESGLVDAREKRVDLTGATAKLCSLCIRDEKGKRIFTNADIAVLGKKSAKATERVSQVAMRLSGMRKDDLEEMVKNSDKIRADDSS